MKTKLITFILIFTSIQSFSQELSEKRIIKKIKLNILEKLIQYQVNSVVEPEQIDDFVKLFKNNQVEILNDIIPDNALDKKIKVEEYIDRVPTFFKDSRTVIVRPYQVNIDQIKDGVGTATANCIKIIIGKEKNGPYFIDTIDIGIKFEFNFTSGEYKIYDIVLNQEPYYYLIIRTFEKSLIRNSLIINDTFIINNKTFISDNNGDILFRYPMDFKNDVKISPKSDQLIGNQLILNVELKKLQYQNTKYHKLNLNKAFFHQAFVSVNPYINYAGLTNSPINSSLTNENDRLSFESGVNILISLFNGNSGAWFIKSGIGLGRFSYDIRNDFIQFTYNEKDPDLTNYLRTNNISNISENNLLSVLIVPILLEKTHNISNSYSLYFDFGATYFKLIKANYSASAIGNYSGNYPELFGITIRENGIYDFGEYNLNETNSPSILNDFWAFHIATGLNRKLNKRLGLYTGLAYKKSFRIVNSKSSNPISRSYSELNSLTSSSISFSLSYISLDLGLVYKL